MKIFILMIADVALDLFVELSQNTRDVFCMHIATYTMILDATYNLV